VMAGNAVALAAQAVREEVERRRTLGIAAEGPIEATRYFESDRPAYAGGTYVVVVEVDPETGAVAVLDHALVHDSGVLINPAVVEGQLHGGVAQGLGGTLLEEVRYEADGALATTSYAAYRVPRSGDFPTLRLDRVETPSTFNPLGIKGVGEAGTIPVPAAVAAAIEDALDGAVRVRRVPVRPPDLHAFIRHPPDRSCR
jgi:aerobic carbon-monoxide dehydrogenase large subunit